MRRPINLLTALAILLALVALPAAGSGGAKIVFENHLPSDIRVTIKSTRKVIDYKAIAANSSHAFSFSGASCSDITRLFQVHDSKGTLVARAAFVLDADSYLGACEFVVRDGDDFMQYEAQTDDVEISFERNRKRKGTFTISPAR